MDEIISYKMCAVKVRNAKLRNYLKQQFGNFSKIKQYPVLFPDDWPVRSSFVSLLNKKK